MNKIMLNRLNPGPEGRSYKETLVDCAKRLQLQLIPKSEINENNKTTFGGN